MINWRSIFSNSNIQFRDTGANTSRNHININCPWCIDDPSFHLSIDETTGAYRCFRNPLKHSGKSAAYLLRALRFTSIEIDQVLRNENTQSVKSKASLLSSFDDVETRQWWARFGPAENYGQARGYLFLRGFKDPEETAFTYNLRFCSYGIYAQRIFFPFTTNRMVMGWTGRAIYDNLQPRYLASKSGSDTLYIPKQVRSNKLILCEGPFDALKLSVSCQWQVASLQGLSLSYAKLNKVIDLCAEVDTIYLMLDKDQMISENTTTFMNEVKTATKRTIKRQLVPNPYKDPGEMPIGEIKQWLSEFS